MATINPAPHADDHGHAHSPGWHYFATFVALLVLMIVTVLASYVNLPGIGPLSGTAINQIVALVIASIKACLVISIFMGLRHGTPLTKLWAVTGFLVFALMFLILGDYFTRKYEPAPSWEPQTAQMRAVPPRSAAWMPKPDPALERELHRPPLRQPWVNLRPRAGAGLNGFQAQP